MSQSRAKKERESERKRSDSQAGLENILRGANAVLSVDLSGVPVTRVSQFAVGWLRAAFEQSLIIATLTASGLGHAAAPNRRAFWELTIRLLWLRDVPRAERATAVDTMLDKERKTEATTDEHMRANGFPTNIDVAEMQAFVLNVTEHKVIRSGAINLTDAVKGTGTNLWMVYRLWRADSTWSHATGFLASSYAPSNDDTTMGAGEPPNMDPDLEAHRYAAMVITATVGDILVDEGAGSDLAGAPMVAYFGAN